MSKKPIIARHSDTGVPDIPRVGEGFFAAGIRVDSPEELWEATGAGVSKQQITLRVDSDVIAFFKQQGKGYQRLMNFALRAYMLRRKSAQSSKPLSRRKKRSA